MTNKTYRAISSTELEVDAPVTNDLLTALRDNQMAIAQGDASAPAQQILTFDSLPTPKAGNETCAVGYWDSFGDPFLGGAGFTLSGQKGTSQLIRFDAFESGTLRIHMQVYFSHWGGGSIKLKRTSGNTTETLLTFSPTGSGNSTVARVAQTIASQTIGRLDRLSVHVDSVPDSATNYSDFWAYVFFGQETQNGLVKLYKDIDELENTSAVINTNSYSGRTHNFCHNMPYHSYSVHNDYGDQFNGGGGSRPRFYNFYPQAVVLHDGV
jgi:hypothetical protein